MMKVVILVNKSQKEVQQAHLNAEKHLINLLKRVYGQARNDCEKKIMELSSRTDLENLQSIIYQKQYQEALKKQLEGILDNLQSEEFTSIADYLQKSYHDGYVGVMYDLTKQGIPLIIPINQEQVVKALQTDSKLSKGLYARLGEDVNYLKRSIRAELSRGIANGSTWNEIAGKIAKGMNSPFNTSINNAIRIARTEGHRVQQSAALDAQYRAKEKGADVLKQWDSTLDNRTRPHHRMLDGQIRELDEDFEIEGMTASAPGHFGKPKEDCNCRCCLLQRARWALDEDELDELKERAAYFGLDKTKDFEEFKQKYLKLPDNADTMKIPTTLTQPLITSSDEAYGELFKRLQDSYYDGMKYNPVELQSKVLTMDEIIKLIAGGDETEGSCASIGLAYIGQRQGLNVLDFRGGKSEEFFSSTYNLFKFSQTDGLVIHKANGACSLTVGNRLLKKCEIGHEYYLCVGRHASIVRKTSKGLEYLEMQSAYQNGWKLFTDDVKHTLSDRFGCSNKKSHSEDFDFMIDIDESNFDSDEFRTLLGYINTVESEQRKGDYGTIK